jgi:hypothetical protein
MLLGVGEKTEYSNVLEMTTSLKQCMDERLFLLLTCSPQSLPLATTNNRNVGGGSFFFFFIFTADGRIK